MIKQLTLVMLLAIAPVYTYAESNPYPVKEFQISLTPVKDVCLNMDFSGTSKDHRCAQSILNRYLELMRAARFCAKRALPEDARLQLKDEWDRMAPSVETLYLTFKQNGINMGTEPLKNPYGAPYCGATVKES
ncbi:hypothetical protein [Neptuniibacter sp. QD37_11]|uniref:hypothetical protein n=1 Tax=Neptuniibacter sp. QD37_11 TaxID=3398209 RepID=UPI0039F57022